MYPRRDDFLEALAAAERLKLFQQDGDRAITQATYRTIKHSQYTTTSGCVAGFWQHLFDRPVVLVPQRQPKSPLLAFPYEAPDPNSPADSRRFVYRSRNGMLHIPFPGEWWIYYFDDGQQDLVCVELDDTAGLAGPQQDRRGIVFNQEDGQDTSPAVAAAAAADIVGDDFRREGVLITNIGDFDIWVRLGSATIAPTTPAAVNELGWPVVPGETLPLIGDMAWRGVVNAIADGGDSEAYVFPVYS